MLVKRRRGWELPQGAVTAHSLFLRRRKLVGALAAGPVLAILGGCGYSATAADVPAWRPRNTRQGTMTASPSIGR